MARKCQDFRVTSCPGSVCLRISPGHGGRHDALPMACGYRFRAVGTRRPRSQLPALWAQDVHLRSPVSPLPHPRRPGGTGLQAQPLSRSPLSRAYQDQEPRDRSLDRPTPLGDRLGRLLLDRPSTVLSALGHPQIRAELLDAYGIKLSDDAIGKYIHRYQAMLAARQQDPEALLRQYQSVDEIILSIDGLQPEKGHETLYIVRELTQKRAWFAEALISATADEVRRLIAKAKGWAESLGKPVGLWLSDRQDAFVTGIAAEFPGVPHRYCRNHFLRDVAKPCLEADSHAKVQMRKKVRRPAEDRTGRAQAAGCRGAGGRGRDGHRIHVDADRRAGGPGRTAGRFRERRGARLLRGGARHSQRRSGRTAPPSRLADGRGLG